MCFCSETQVKADENYDIVSGWKYRCLSLIIASAKDGIHINDLLAGIESIYYQGKVCRLHHQPCFT